MSEDISQSLEDKSISWIGIGNLATPIAARLIAAGIHPTLYDIRPETTAPFSGKAEIAAIRAALGRIEEGIYGECVQCGDDIAEARLDLLPFTPFCADCARKLHS